MVPPWAVHCISDMALASKREKGEAADSLKFQGVMFLPPVGQSLSVTRPAVIHTNGKQKFLLWWSNLSMHARREGFEDSWLGMRVCGHTSVFDFIMISAVYPLF